MKKTLATKGKKAPKKDAAEKNLATKPKELTKDKKRKREPEQKTEELKQKRKYTRKLIADNTKRFKFEASMFHFVNYVSSLKSIKDFIATLTPRQRQSVEDIGFGALLGIKLTEIDRRLYPLLTAAYDSMVLTLHDNSVIHANSIFFYEVLAIPYKNRKVYGKSKVCTGMDVLDTSLPKEDVKAIKKRWKEFFHLRDNKFVSATTLQERLTEERDGGDLFKKLFVLFVVSMFLVPCGDKSLVLKILPALEDVRRISNYDWCAYVASNLDMHIRRLKSSIEEKIKKEDDAPFKPHGTTRFQNKVGGCFPALLIGYIHKYVFGETLTDTISYIHSWDDAKLRKRIVREVESLYVGTTKLVVDVQEPTTNGEEIIHYNVSDDFNSQQEIRQIAEDLLFD